MAGQDLLIEIGMEELPARFLEQSLADFAYLLNELISQNKIYHGNIKEMGTPRRLALLMQNVVDKGETVTKTVTGPPKRIAFDDQGNPTKAAVGFAKTQGVEVEQLQILEGEKGEYLAVTLEQPGRETSALLTEHLANIILSPALSQVHALGGTPQSVSPGPSTGWWSCWETRW